jgi:cytochrome c oxidase subunit III
MEDSALLESICSGNAGRPGNGGASGGGGENEFHAAGVPQRTYVTGMVVTLGGVTMFFVALVSAWIVRKGFPNNDWQRLEIPRILWLNTAILLASSFTLARSRRFLLARQEGGFRHWWGVTAILGVFFLAGQVIAWWQLASADFFLATNPSSSFFYVFTAAHGLHVVGGLAALLIVPLWPSQRLARATLIEVVAIYWHFMDALWLFLFLLLMVGK